MRIKGVRELTISFTNCFKFYIREYAGSPPLWITDITSVDWHIFTVKSTIFFFLWNIFSSLNIPKIWNDLLFQLFDHCLAPNTHGDGTGCDNMTCVIVLLNSFTGNPGSPLTRVSTSVTAAASSTESIIKDFKEADKADSSSASDESPAAQDKSSGALKRCADNTDVVSSSDEKRQKLEEEVA